MFKSSFQRIDLEIESYHSKYLQKRTESLRTILLDNPKQEIQWTKYDFTRLYFGNLRLRQKIALTLMSWYMNEEIRFLVQMELREIWGGDSREVMEVLLTSKEFALTWIYSISGWNERILFGNVLNRELGNLWQRVDFRRLSQRKVRRYTGYCRGYQESSRRAPSPLPAELRPGTLSYEEYLERKTKHELSLQSLLQRVRLEYSRLIAG
jgi:hypothetical protein